MTDEPRTDEANLVKRRTNKTAMTTQQELTPMGMISSIVQQGADPEALERVTAWAERMQANEARRAFAQAMGNFKAICPTVAQLSKGHTNKYAKLVDIDEQIRPALTQCQLSPSWRVTRNDKDWIEVECRVTHVLGHYESTSFGGPPDRGAGRNELQARASTVTYLERYTLKAILGVVDKDMPDNDGADGKDTEKTKPGTQELLNQDAEEKAARERFRKVAIKQAKVALANTALHKLLAAVREASGQEGVAECATWLEENDVHVGKDGSLAVVMDDPTPISPGPDGLSNPRVVPEAVLDDSGPAVFDFQCSRCGKEFRVKPAKGQCDKCLGLVKAKED